MKIRCQQEVKVDTRPIICAQKNSCRRRLVDGGPEGPSSPVAKCRPSRRCTRCKKHRSTTPEKIAGLLSTARSSLSPSCSSVILDYDPDFCFAAFVSVRCDFFLLLVFASPVVSLGFGAHVWLVSDVSFLSRMFCDWKFLCVNTLLVADPFLLSSVAWSDPVVALNWSNLKPFSINTWKEPVQVMNVIRQMSQNKSLCLFCQKRRSSKKK